MDTIPADLRGLSIDQLESKASVLNEAVAAWETRSGDAREYNALVAKASLVNQLVDQMQTPTN